MNLPSSPPLPPIEDDLRRSGLRAIGFAPILGVILILVLASTATAQGLRTFDLPTMERLGLAMYEQDIRAARATDLVQEAKVDLNAEGVLGWIVVEAGSTQTVRFFARPDGVYLSRVDVIFVGNLQGRVVRPEASALSAEEVVLARARLAVREDLLTLKDRCPGPYNTITLPDPDGRGWLVWAIAATVDPNEIRVGGHFRYTVDEQGEIEARDKLYKSCLVLDQRKMASGSNGALVAVSMGWIVSDTPLEIHVFLQRQRQVPFFIMTTSNGRIWEVDRGRITDKN